MSHNYKRAFAEGHQYNELVAKYLKRRGIDCFVPELKFAKDSTEWKNFTNNEKDIILSSGRIIEVKSSGQVFDWSPKSWPLNSVIVDTKSGYDAKVRRPIAYVYVSQETKAMLAIPTEKPNNWTVQRKFDKYRKIEDDFYFAPRTHLRPMENLVKYLMELENEENNN